MKFFSRLCLASGMLAAIFFLSGCQGLVAGSGGTNPPPPPPPPTNPSKVTVTLAGSGDGTITSSPTGINCGATCTADFADGDITLTAAPGTSFTFDGWSGACSGTAATCLIPAGSTATASATFSATLQSVNHIIFLMQENRSFDHYFGHMNDYRGSLGLSTDVDGTPGNASNPPFDPMGSAVTPFHMNSFCIENPSPFWNESHKSFNRDNPMSATAKLDGFVWAGAHFAIDSPPETDVEGRRVMGYYDSTDLPFYYFMAANFAMSDRWFSSVMTRTQPNRMFTMAATSDGHIYPLNGGKSARKTIFQLLQENNITWRIYVADGSPTLVQGSDLVMFTYADAHPENFALESQFATDVASGNLPQVVFISEGHGTDEHPADAAQGAGGNVDLGAKYVRNTFIMPLIQSPIWKDSVFILAWDEGGGFYDHVPPQTAVPPDNIAPSDLGASDMCFGVAPSGSNNCGFNFTGFRVPMMVISPFAKKNYVSHTVADHTAVLKFIETRFSLPNLTERDKAQMDMTEFFDFVNAPWKTPPTTIPEQPGPGPCYITSLP